MPNVADGSSATITVADNTLLTVVVNGGAVRYENPVGTVVAEFGADRVFGPLSAGSVKLTSVQGAFSYETGTANTASANYVPSSVAITGGTIGGVTLTGPMTVACLGDSITAYNSTSDNFNARGYLTQARAYSLGRFVFTPSLNFGVSGETSAQIAARVSSVIAARPSICCVMAGTNDPTTGSPLAKEQTWANLLATYSALISQGIKVVACPIIARSDFTPLAGGAVTTARQQCYWVNNKIREYAQTVGPGAIRVANTDNALIAMGNANGDPIPGTLTDGIHPSDYGGELLGLAVADALSGWLAPSSLFTRSRANTYSATDNPLGNRLFDMGSLVGSAGTASTGVTGSVTTSMTAIRLSGSTLTAVGSKGAYDSVTGGETQILTLGGGSGGSGLEELVFTRDLASGSGSWAAGDVLILEAEVDADSLVNVNNVYVFVAALGTVNSTKTSLARTNITSDRARDTWSKVLSTPAVTVGSDTTTVRCRIGVMGDCTGAGVSGVLTIKSLNLRTARSIEL